MPPESLSIERSRPREYRLKTRLSIAAMPPSQLPRNIWNRQPVRLGFAALLAVTAVVAIAPSLYSQSSLDAVVNTHYVAIHTPIEGSVVSETLSPGQRIGKDQVIAQIRNDRLNRGVLQELTTEYEGLRARVAALEGQRKTLTELRGDLDRRRQDHLGYEISYLGHEITEARARLNAQKAEQANLKGIMNRKMSLAQNGWASTQAYETAIYSYQAATAQSESLTARINVLESQLKAARSGILLGDGRNDVPYSNQRIDEIDMQAADLTSRIVEQSQRIGDLSRQIGVEKERLARAEEAQLTSPFDGIVWRQFFTKGNDVVVGSEVAQIADCDHTFLDITTKENAIDDIAIGDAVRYRLIGSADYHAGTVSAATGSGNSLQDRTLAAKVDQEPGDARVFVAISATDIDPDHSNFCQIGRKAEVRFSRKWKLTAMLSRFFGIF